MKKTLQAVRRVCKKSLSILLAFSMMISVCIISGFSVSGATGSSVFSAGDYIYVSKVNASGIGINDKIKCHMYRSWPDSQSDSYIDSIYMQKISNDYYRCFMLADDVKYLKFMLNDDSNWWIENGGNQVYSVDYNDSNNNPCGSATNNCIYIYNTSANSTGWGSINSNDPDNTFQNGKYDEKTATLSSTITNNVGKNAGNLTLVNGTFFDYYNNDEIRKGWINGLDGSERSYLDREPFTFFNKAVADYAGSNTAWSYPLYFGDFNRSGTSDGGPGPWDNGYTGAGVSNLYNYKARANNSQKTSSGVNGAVSGLVDQNLSSGNITAGGVTLPYFSRSFLSKGYGAVVNSQFVFRNEVRNGDMYHVYDSTGGKDNFYFSSVTSSPVAHYHQDSYRTQDAVTGFSGATSNGYGFFPFDQAATYANDFGFGMKLEIPFVLREDGKTENGNDVVFNFSGDDDLWVYVDNKLVLDMGGAHKMATGSINFTQKTSSVSSLDTSYGTKTASVGDIEWGKAHTMTVFYMERGMVESNLKVEYNFEVLDNLLTVDKTVNTENVNNGLKTAVAALDEFAFVNASNGTDNTSSTVLKDTKFTITNADNVQSAGTFGTDGSYKLKNGYQASFPDVTDAGNYITVTETGASSSNLTYSTAYTVTDVQNSKAITSASGTSANFEYLNSVDSQATTYYNVKFVNTPAVNDLAVSKTAYDTDGSTKISDEEFEFTVMVDLNGGTNYSAYDLEYSVTEGSTLTATGGKFKLKGGQTATFKNIPVNASYKVVETADADYTTEPSNRTISDKISTSTNTASFVNTKIDKSDATVTLGATKLLDGEASDTDIFEFTLTELTKNGSAFSDTKNLIQTVKNKGGTVQFDTLKYPYVEQGTTQSGGSELYYYEIAENALSNTAYSYDDSKYYVVVKVDRSVTPNTASAKYYATATDAINETNAIEANDVVFNNFHLGSMEITKFGAQKETIKDSVKFKLYKTDSNGGELTEANYVEEKTVDSNGKVLFDNLDIFVGQSEEKADSYQWYCFVESDTKDGYSLNGTKYYFTIPLAQEVEDQNSDTYDFEANNVKYEFVLKDGARVYDLKCDVDNFLVTSPNASGKGMNIFLVIGLGILMTGGLFFTAYITYDKVQRKKRMARHAKRY